MTKEPEQPQKHSENQTISRSSLLRQPISILRDNINTLFQKVVSESLEDKADSPHIRRRILVEKSVKDVTENFSSFVEPSAKLMTDVFTHLTHIAYNRRYFLAAMAVVGIVGSEVVRILQANPNLLKQSEAAAKLAPVWQELQALGKEYSNTELQKMTYNPFKRIKLTTREAAHTLFVGNGDSIYLYKGIRLNSQGIKQPNSWLTFAKKKINDGLALLGIQGDTDYANYAQPGAASNETVGPQRFGPGEYGNVQLGARTVEDMKADNPDHPEQPPYDLMIHHEGTLIAAYGIHGDDMRDTASLAIQYLDSKSQQYDREFATFVKSPSKDNLTPHIADVLLSLINSYKKDRERIKENFAKALSIYREINKIRLERGLGKMYLVVTQPMRLDEAQNAPYTPLDAKRGTKGTIHLDQYGQGGKLAGRMVMLPFYQEEAPLLQSFEQSTREDGSEVQVTSVPLLALSGQNELVIWDGHYNDVGEETIWAEVGKTIEVVDPSSGSNLHFKAHGQPTVQPIT